MILRLWLKVAIRAIWRAVVENTGVGSDGATKTQPQLTQRRAPVAREEFFRFTDRRGTSAKDAVGTKTVDGVTDDFHVNVSQNFLHRAGLHNPVLQEWLD